MEPSSIPSGSVPDIDEKQRFDISLEDLQTFLVVADLGSFSRAAAQLHLSQPSVSNRVRRLEEKLATKLLDRTTRKVDLTSDGQRLKMQAAVTLRALRSLCQEFYAQSGARRKQVDVAATVMVATIALPPIVRNFNERHPDIVVRFQDRIPTEAVHAVQSGDCDMAVMVLDKERPDVDFEPLLSDRCVVVTPLNHPLLASAEAMFADVLRYNVLSPDGHVALRQAIATEAEARGLLLRLAPEARNVSNVMTLLGMAAAGFGVAIHPQSLIPAEFRPAVGVVPMADCEIVRTFGIVTARDRPLSASARLFQKFLRESTSQLDGWQQG